MNRLFKSMSVLIASALILSACGSKVNVRSSQNANDFQRVNHEETGKLSNRKTQVYIEEITRLCQNSGGVSKCINKDTGESEIAFIVGEISRILHTKVTVNIVRDHAAVKHPITEILSEVQIGSGVTIKPFLKLRWIYIGAEKKGELSRGG